MGIHPRFLPVRDPKVLVPENPSTPFSLREAEGSVETETIRVAAQETAAEAESLAGLAATIETVTDLAAVDLVVSAAHTHRQVEAAYGGARQVAAIQSQADAVLAVQIISVAGLGVLAEPVAAQRALGGIEPTRASTG